MAFSRRDFIATAVAGSLSLGIHPKSQAQKADPKNSAPGLARLPMIISAGYGLNPVCSPIFVSCSRAHCFRVRWNLHEEYHP